jgi:hypothetical protein
MNKGKELLKPEGVYLLYKSRFEKKSVNTVYISYELICCCTKAARRRSS